MKGYIIIISAVDKLECSKVYKDKKQAEKKFEDEVEKQISSWPNSTYHKEQASETYEDGSRWFGIWEGYEYNIIANGFVNVYLKVVEVEG